MSNGRGPQVVYLNDGAQLAARGAHGRTMRENVAFKELLEQIGAAPDGNSVDGTSRSGSAAWDALYGQGGSGGGVSNVVGVGDGVTDDSDAVRDAIAALGGMPGVVYFPPGRYLIQGEVILLPSGTRVTGAGPAISVIVVGLTTYGDGTSGVFRNTTTEPWDTDLPAIPANQVDHDIQIDNLGFDFSAITVATHIAGFILARNIVIDNVISYQPLDTRPWSPPGPPLVPPRLPAYEGFKFVGCDNVVVSRYRAFQTSNAVDCWKAPKRVRISDCLFVGRFANSSNGGLINWNSIGSGQHDYGDAIDLQVVNTTFWLHCDPAILTGPGTIALYLDPLGPGSRSQEMLISNCTISSRMGFNTAIIARGLLDRLVLRGVSFNAQPGADLRPFLTGAVFAGGGVAVLTDKIETVAAAVDINAPAAGSNLVTIDWQGVDGGGDPVSSVALATGNYVWIRENDSPTFSSLDGNGVSLHGYYPIVSHVNYTAPGSVRRPGRPFSLSGPAVDPHDLADLQTSQVTVLIPGQYASAAGVVAPGVAARVTGYYGHPHACDLSGLAIDGIKNRNGDLILWAGDSCRISGVVVSPNYGAQPAPPELEASSSPVPQYRSIVAIEDVTNLQGDLRAPNSVSGVVGAPGIFPLSTSPPWSGDNVISWSNAALLPVLDIPMKGAWLPELRFNGVASAGATYGERSGTWMKTGALIVFAFQISLPNKGSSVGEATIAGLPFASNSWGGQGRGTFTANFGTALASSPSGTTTPIVYTRSVGSLLFTITTPGTGGTTNSIDADGRLTGYALTLTGGTGSGATATFQVRGADTVQGLTKTNVGSGGQDGRYPLIFTPQPAPGGSGSGATGDVLVTGGIITELRLLSGGRGYSMAPAVGHAVPGLIGAVITAVPGVGGVTAIDVQTRGVYTVAPTATAPGVTGAVITATVNTAGISEKKDVIGAVSPTSKSIALKLGVDFDGGGMPLTSSEFANTVFLHMSGWYLTDA